LVRTAILNSSVMHSPSLIRSSVHSLIHSLTRTHYHAFHLTNIQRICRGNGLESGKGSLLPSGRSLSSTMYGPLISDGYRPFTRTAQELYMFGRWGLALSSRRKCCRIALTEDDGASAFPLSLIT
jgi:hypothetical protein